MLMTVPARAFVFTDPIAQVQRAASSVEQKIQTSYMYKTMLDTYNNYQAAKMTYDMAKAGYEKATNPEEWKALGEYEKMRLQGLSNPSTDPTQASLFRTVKSLDAAADSYMANTDLFVQAQALGQQSGAAISHADQSSSNFLESNTPLGQWSSVANAADQKTAEWNLAHDALLASKLDATNLSQSAQQVTNDSLAAAQELDKLQKVEFYAEQQYQLELSQSQSGGSASDNKSKQLKLDNARKLVQEIQNRKLQLQKKAEALKQEATDLQKRIDDNNNKLALAAASFGLDAFAARLMQEANLSRMGDSEVWVRQVSVIAFWMLLIALSLALLWKGYGSVAHNDGAQFPHDVILGLIAAFVFITPGSPVHVQKIARQVAIVSDAMEMTLYSDSLFKTQSTLLSGMGTVLFKNPTGLVSSMIPTKVQDAYDQQVQKMGIQGQSSMFKGAASILLGPSSVINSWILQLIAAFCSYMGVLTVIISFNFRTIVYWVLVSVAPMLIALAPLPWGRVVLRGLGISLYAVIMWGFISRVILLLNNNIAMHNLQVVTSLFGAQSAMSMFISMMDGLMLIILMIFSPMMAYSLAKGSFDGLVAGASTIAASAGGGIFGGIASRGIFLAQSMGSSAKQIISKARGLGSGANKVITKAQTLGSAAKNVESKIGSDKK